MQKRLDVQKAEYEEAIKRHISFIDQVRPRMYINILLDTVLATDVNKYALASASCQPIWRTLVGELDLFLAVAKDCGIVLYLNQSQQSISPCFG